MKLKFRKGVFIVVYSFYKNNLEYLLLKRKLHWTGWEFPKGAVEKFETKRMAVKRETMEETGLVPVKIKKHKFSGKYLYSRTLSDRPNVVGQTFSLYSVEVEKRKIKIDRHEHSRASWFSYKDAVKKLTYDDQKKSLKIVNEWLTKKLDK